MDSSPTLLRSGWPASGRRSVIALTPLVFLFLALLLSAIPLWDEAPVWTSGLFVCCVAGRIFLNRRHLELPPLSVRLLLLAIATSTILAQYGTFLGVQPGFGILLVLVSLKVLETNGRRDFQILTLLGYFLSLCTLFFSQDLNHWLYVGLTLTLLTAAMICLQQGDSRGAFFRSLRLSSAMLAQSLPLVCLLFLFCPRPSGEFRFFLGASPLGGTGMAERLQPGSFARLASRSDIAFHASFPDGFTAPPQGLYWRGLVLCTNDGLTWDRGVRIRMEAPGESRDLLSVRQEIYLEPHSNNWLFALDRPVTSPAFADYGPGGDLRSRHPITSRTPYEVISQTQSVDTAISPQYWSATLRVPNRVSPAVRALADSFWEGASGELAVAQHALDYFKKNHFAYSMEPGAYPSNELDEFLFHRRIGFCEHYAAAFASLMRLSGIPSRVITGYLGGEYNPIGDYYIVRQSDAHAWCEIWVNGRGWVRIDPTSVTAPERINFGLQDYLASQQSGSPGMTDRIPGGEAWHSFFRQGALLWDNLTYQWDLRVLTYGGENQRSFLTAVGFGTWSWHGLAFSLILVAALFLLALALWLRQPATSPAPALKAYARFVRRGAAAGIVRQPGEGPLAFTERLAVRFPARAAEIRQVGSLYAAIRYGRQAPATSELVRAIHKVGFLRP